MQLLVLAAAGVLRAAQAPAEPAHPVEWLRRLPRILDAKDQCMSFGLPSVIYSSPSESSGLDRHGSWETHDGAALANWAQTQVGEETQMEVSVMGRVYYRLSTRALDPDQDDPRHPGRETAVTTAENCEGVALFSLLERPGGDAPLELYEWVEPSEETQFPASALLAHGFVSKLDTRDFVWEDARNVSLAQASVKTPSIATTQDMAVADLNVFGGMKHFELSYFDASLVNQSESSFLLDPHVRFVLAAATQFRELREADRGSTGTVRLMGQSKHLKTLTRIVEACAVFLGLLIVCAGLYVCIYPGKERKGQLVDRVKAWAAKYKAGRDQGVMQLSPEQLHHALRDDATLKLRDGRTVLTVDGRRAEDRRDLDRAMATGRVVAITAEFDHQLPWSDAVDFGRGPGEPDLYRRGQEQGGWGPRAAGAPFAEAYRPDLGYGTSEPAFVPRPRVDHHVPGPVRSAD